MAINFKKIVRHSSTYLITTGKGQIIKNGSKARYYNLLELFFYSEHLNQQNKPLFAPRFGSHG